MSSEDTKKETTPISITEKVLEKIEEGKIKPRPRWIYIVKETFFWLAWFLATVVGALAISAMVFVIKHSGWGYRQATHDSTVRFIIDFVPYLWLALLVVMVFAAYLVFKKTQRGYRVNFPLAILASLLVSLIGGLILYLSCFGASVDNFTSSHFPFYRSVTSEQQKIWLSPEKGLLAGEISFVENGDVVMVSLQAFDGSEWILDVSDLASPDWQIVESFDSVRIIGVPVEEGSEENIFKACFIFPWEFSNSGSGRPMLLQVERKISEPRSISCKAIKPYQALEHLRELTH